MKELTKSILIICITSVIIFFGNKYFEIKNNNEKNLGTEKFFQPLPYKNFEPLTYKKIEEIEYKPDTGKPASIKLAIAPKQPKKSKDAGESGIIRVRVVISENGEPIDVEVYKSSGFSDLDFLAVHNVKKNYQFNPAIKNGKPIKSVLYFNVFFPKKT